MMMHSLRKLRDSSSGFELAWMLIEPQRRPSDGNIVSDLLNRQRHNGNQFLSNIRIMFFG
jgi:hypothetical protein